MSTLRSVCFLIWTTICCAQAAQQLYEGDVCASDGSKCENLKNCKILHDDVQKGKRPPLCGFKENEVIVCCCPDLVYRFNAVNTSISYDACQWYKDEACPQTIMASTTQNTTPVTKYTASTTKKASTASSLAVPPKPTNVEENLPFMALIGYGLKNKIAWLCGGVLISRRYVLATAHCSKHMVRGVASWVRFKNDDVSNMSNIYAIVKLYNHHDYHPPAQYNDIALYRLDRIVKITTLVRPICLPQLYAEYEYPYNFYGSGWINKNNKLEAFSSMLKEIPSGSCAFAGTAQQIPYGTDYGNTLCVNGYDGGYPSGCRNDFIRGAFFTTDAAKCDSGILLGISSIGKLCNGKDVIGIYTNVTRFMPWIESIVWPENSTYIEILWSN